MPDNCLYYGDNLDILRRYGKDESVDLVYLDPPFNSKATYNMLFGEQDGTRSASQIKAFGDTWRWDSGAAETLLDITRPVRQVLLIRLSPSSKCLVKMTCWPIS